MASSYTLLVNDFERHDVASIKARLENGADPNQIENGKPIFIWLLEMYTRGPRFQQCVQAFIDAGLKFKDEPLLAVLADNASKLEQLIITDPTCICKTYDILNATYTSLMDATLLHFCAEYNSLNCAKVLVKHGADINARAGVDAYGFGGHTPIFHTVNQNGNHSADMLHFLLDHKVDLNLTVKGLIWGKGYEWETFIPAVNPLSYARMGSLPQMHRKQETVAAVVSLLLKHAYGIDYLLPNVPNMYLR